MDGLFEWATGDGEEGRRLRDEGMQRAVERAGEPFVVAGLAVLTRLAATLTVFCSDEFWLLLGQMYPRYVERNAAGGFKYGDAAGSVFTKAYKRGIIRKTGRRVKLTRPEAHGKDAPELTGGATKPCPHCHGTGRGDL
jgi:hypothetical protein